ncbi:hypothetical protein GCM10010350_01610 [Streptomyces galilaeus]|nr:hypothetical protein GCM10010350_01610 [Streptomyces galilaeus]
MHRGRGRPGAWARACAGRRLPWDAAGASAPQTPIGRYRPANRRFYGVSPARICQLLGLLPGLRLGLLPGLTGFADSVSPGSGGPPRRTGLTARVPPGRRSPCTGRPHRPLPAHHELVSRSCG